LNSGRDAKGEKTLDPRDHAFHATPQNRLEFGRAAEPAAKVVVFKHHGGEVS